MVLQAQLWHRPSGWHSERAVLWLPVRLTAEDERLSRGLSRDRFFVCRHARARFCTRVHLICTRVHLGGTREHTRGTRAGGAVHARASL